MTVTAPGSGGPLPDLLDRAPPRSRGPWTGVSLALGAVVVVGAAVLRGADQPPVPARTSTPRAVTPDISATASLAGAATDEPYVQRLTLTVDLPAFVGGGVSGGRLPGDEVLLVGARARGFAVEPDDPRPLVPLGRFGRADTGRSTTLPATVAVVDCSVETQARRDIVLTVRTGGGPDGDVRAVADADVVRALDRLVSRTCRRPRG